MIGGSISSGHYHLSNQQLGNGIDGMTSVLLYPSSCTQSVYENETAVLGLKKKSKSEQLRTKAWQIFFLNEL